MLFLVFFVGVAAAYGGPAGIVVVLLLAGFIAAESRGKGL